MAKLSKPEDNDIAIGVFEEFDPEKAKQLIHTDPYEFVLYLARCGRDEDARNFMQNHLPRLQAQKEGDAGELPTLTDGVLLAGPNQEGRCIIGVGGRRFDVLSQIKPPPPPEAWVPGREVWVHPETMTLLKLRETYVQGDVAQVVETIDPARDVPEAGNTDSPASGAQAQFPRALLRVSCRQEEIVVEAVPSLAEKKPVSGDTVRIIPALGIALELLTRGRGDLLLGEIPDVEYTDIGGLDSLINQIKEAIEDPLVFPTVFQDYQLQRPRGILLYGPPGCGKTMIAKAIANNLSRQIESVLQDVERALEAYLGLAEGEGDQKTKSSDEQNARKLGLEKFLRSRGISPSQAPAELSRIKLALEQGGRSYFVSIKGPELLSKWVGETESSIRSIFAMARERATFYTPVVLFFDELESMFSRRGSGISSDVQKTIVPQLLAEIDGVEETRNIIIIGASNRFDLIDPAVLRPGRLDFKIKIPRPDRDAARSILARYLNADVPFLSEHVQEFLEPEHRRSIGQVAGDQTVMDNSLGAALDLWISASPGTKAAVFLTELYQGHPPPAKKLLLHATAGIDADTEESVLTSWGDEAGIGWRTIHAAGSLREDVDAADEKRIVVTSPLISTGDNPTILGALISSHPARSMPADLDQRLSAMAGALTALITARTRIAGQLIERVLNILYNPESYLLITELIDARRAAQRGRDPRTMKKKVEEIVSGAMLESIVSRAKREAVRREIIRQRQSLEQPGMLHGADPYDPAVKADGKVSGGIRWHDLYVAIYSECTEGKDQYIYELYADDPFGRDQAYQDSEKFHVDPHLPPEDAEISQSTWLTNKSRAWRKTQPEAPAPEARITG